MYSDKVGGPTMASSAATLDRVQTAEPTQQIVPTSAASESCMDRRPRRLQTRRSRTCRGEAPRHEFVSYATEVIEKITVTRDPKEQMEKNFEGLMPDVNLCRQDDKEWTLGVSENPWVRKFVQARIY